jgi:hypothetical protein
MSRFTPEQKTKIMRLARELVSGRRAFPRSSTSRTSTTTSRPSTTPRRSDQSTKLVHKTRMARDDDFAEPATTTRAVTAPAATSSEQQPWWEWVQEHVDYRFNVLSEACGTALGEMTRDLWDQAKKADASLKADVKLLRREIALLREEVKAERGLHELNRQVAEARAEMPKLPAIEARLRGEASIARVDIGAEQAKLRAELETTKRTVSVLRARSTNLNSNLSQFMRGVQDVQTNEIEYESAEQRMIIRRKIHPEAAEALREFASKVIDGQVVH